MESEDSINITHGILDQMFQILDTEDVSRMVNNAMLDYSITKKVKMILATSSKNIIL